MVSGDLEQLLMAQGSLPDGAASLFAPGRAPSFNIGKLESLNLPEDALAAAMAQMERAGVPPGAGLPALRQQSQQAAAAAPATAAQGEQQQQQQPGGGGERPQAQQGRQQSPAQQAPAANANGISGSAAGEGDGGPGQRLTPAKRKA